MTATEPLTRDFFEKHLDKRFAAAEQASDKKFAAMTDLISGIVGNMATKTDLQEFRTEMNTRFEDTAAFFVEHVDNRLQLFSESLSPFIDRTAMIEPMAHDIYGLKQDMKIVKVAIKSISRQLQGACLHG
ncbi:MAG: hypothetical protein JWM81_65 [Candidatus Saccharibacteria bacterium]|nr:hypothetical protein [Candidatus Saccharibacteria bacterium]